MPQRNRFETFLDFGCGMALNGRMAIEPGTQLRVTTASGQTVTVRAIGLPEQGRDFPVVWVCTEEEYERAALAGAEPDGLPWPLHAVAEPQLA